MPFVDDERMPSASPLTLKRGRSDALHLSAPMTAPSPSLKRQSGLLRDELSLLPQEEENELDEDFDLGPPPPPPVLFRQNAMDATAARQAKFCRSVADHGSSSSSPNSPPEVPSLLPRSSLSLSSSRARGFMVAPMVRPSLQLALN